MTIIRRRVIESIIKKFLEKKKRSLLIKTKALSRRYLYEFIEDSLAGVFTDRAVTKRIINVGSGGKISKMIEKIAREKETQVTSIDIDLSREPDVVSDVRDLSFSDSSFDCVVCAEVLEHVFYPHESIKELHRVLVKGGKLILTTRFIFPLHDRPNDYFRFTKYGLVKLLSDFSKIDIHEQLNWIETLATLVIRLLKEDKKWVLILAPLIYFIGRLMDMTRKILIKRFNTDYIASGYLVVAIK